MTNNDPSPRAAKRSATFDAIEEAATGLVLERDFDSVTVEEICARAGVSRRTFFNYFDSKETAVFGIPASVPAQRAAESFLEAEHPDLIAALVRLYVDHVIFGPRPDGQRPTAAVVRRRKVINRRSPHSVARRCYRAPELLNDLHGLISRYLDRHPGRLAEFCAAGVAASDCARGLLVLSIAASHLGIQHWVNSESTDLADLTPICQQALGEIRALAAYAPPANAPEDRGHTDSEEASS
ncbi:TetR/AcrR family transcriptional regulator [Corynebacterium atypicum]|uniref:TetR/AcrR family transcriptional regulator n=1 Tax=Corynebacterium atypicum TaxID=191610 RepID=UPI000B1B9EA0|nr:TetR/AcrR family transcriptional regulator [Corynebacterium atypicum]